MISALYLRSDQKRHQQIEITRFHVTPTYGIQNAPTKQRTDTAYIKCRLCFFCLICICPQYKSNLSQNTSYPLIFWENIQVTVLTKEYLIPEMIALEIIEIKLCCCIRGSFVHAKSKTVNQWHLPICQATADAIKEEIFLHPHSCPEHYRGISIHPVVT